MHTVQGLIRYQFLFFQVVFIIIKKVDKIIWLMQPVYISSYVYRNILVFRYPCLNWHFRYTNSNQYWNQYSTISFQFQHRQIYIVVVTMCANLFIKTWENWKINSLKYNLELFVVEFNNLHEDIRLSEPSFYTKIWLQSFCCSMEYKNANNP